MIAIDTSAIIAIALLEPESEPFSELLVREGAVVPTTVLVEASLVLARKMPAFGEVYLRGFMARNAVTAVDFSFPMYEEAHRGFHRFGSGKSGLNFGDCLTYGAAKVLGLPLLFTGLDFTRTDLRPAYVA